MYYRWKIKPLCEEQLLDVIPSDILAGGMFRTCDVYGEGVIYDMFPKIYEKRTGIKTKSKQFVAQLYGCHLSCPYCYVTPNGIWGDYVEYTTKELVEEFVKADVDVFHLMGGSPALYIDHWPELISMLSSYGDYVFHSDLLLTEKRYNRLTLKAIAQENCLYAVNIKGVTPEDYKRNTGKELGNVFWLNLYDLVVAEVPFYITFTNPDMNHYDEFCDWVDTKMPGVRGKGVLDDSFIVKLVDYKAVRAYKNKEKEKKHE